jgi:hypothetical protein
LKLEEFELVHRLVLCGSSHTATERARSVGHLGWSCIWFLLCSLCVFACVCLFPLCLLGCVCCLMFCFCLDFVDYVLSGWAFSFWRLCCPAFHLSLSVNLYHVTERDGGKIDLQRETEQKARQPETKLSAIAQTRHIARLRDAERSRTRTPNPRTGQETGLNNLSRGLGETAHRSPAGGTRRDVRAGPTQGRVAPAKGNAKLP